MLTAGDRIPDFSLTDDQGNTVTQDDFAGRTVVLYFYPKDDTPGCTKQACAFRDGLEAFEERGASVIGVSADDIPSHQAFKAKFGLNFPLLADTEKVLCDAFGVWGEQEWKGQKYMGIKRNTYVVRDGVITEVFPDVSVMGHAERVLAVL